MIKYFKYLSYVLRHKLWVTYYCFKSKLIWRGITHDLSKFLPDEFFPYANYFYGKKGKEHQAKRKMKNGYYKPYQTGDEKFDFAWLKHQKRNRHHWQWWILPKDDEGTIVMPMKEADWKEMICDWRGAGRAQGYGDNTIKWYEEHKNKMQLHKDTREKVELELSKIYCEVAIKIVKKAYRRFEETNENNKR